MSCRVLHYVGSSHTVKDEVWYYMYYDAISLCSMLPSEADMGIQPERRNHFPPTTCAASRLPSGHMD
jgi:hypothetical protein